MLNPLPQILSKKISYEAFFKEDFQQNFFDVRNKPTKKLYKKEHFKGQQIHEKSFQQINMKSPPKFRR
jgi:hypothetical protein